MYIIEKCGRVVVQKNCAIRTAGWAYFNETLPTHIPEQALVMFWKKELKIIFSTQSFEDRWSDLMCLLLAV